jgi:hypothetical protein
MEHLVCDGLAARDLVDQLARTLRIEVSGPLLFRYGARCASSAGIGNGEIAPFTLSLGYRLDSLPLCRRIQLAWALAGVGWLSEEYAHRNKER